jgi:hypothetical protein
MRIANHSNRPTGTVGSCPPDVNPRRGAFNTESERGRMPEKFRPVRGDPSVLNPSLDRSDERCGVLSDGAPRFVLGPKSIFRSERANDRDDALDDVFGRAKPIRNPSIPDWFFSPGRPGHPPRRASLGVSLVLPGDFGKETDRDVTRFFKRLCSETRRCSDQNVGFLRKATPPRAPVLRGAHRHDRNRHRDRSGVSIGIFSRRISLRRRLALRSNHPAQTQVLRAARAHLPQTQEVAAPILPTTHSRKALRQASASNTDRSPPLEGVTSKKHLTIAQNCRNCRSCSR